MRPGHQGWAGGPLGLPGARSPRHGRRPGPGAPLAPAGSPPRLGRRSAESERAAAQVGRRRGSPGSAEARGRGPGVQRGTEAARQCQPPPAACGPRPLGAGRLFAPPAANQTRPRPPPPGAHRPPPAPGARAGGARRGRRPGGARGSERGPRALRAPAQRTVSVPRPGARGFLSPRVPDGVTRGTQG